MKRFSDEEAPPIYEWDGPTGVHFKQIKQPSGVYYHHDCNEAVIKAIELARERDLKIRLFYGDTETGRDWLDENDVCGWIGCSTGPIRIPIIKEKHNDDGGPGILERRILRIIMRTPGGSTYEAYRHPLYKPPVIEITTEKSSHAEAGYTHKAEVNGEIHARFKSHSKATSWKKFMLGESITKP